jgi:hypothetical protein
LRGNRRLKESLSKLSLSGKGQELVCLGVDGQDPGKKVWIIWVWEGDLSLVRQKPEPRKPKHVMSMKKLVGLGPGDKSAEWTHARGNWKLTW